jgi:hypothetical protein
VTTLEKLKDAKNLTDVAKILGFTPSGLSYVLYKLPPAKKYVTFTIPKKSGGTREINAPVQPLKLLQRRLANVLYQCRSELEKKTPRRHLSHGFKLDCSIVTNARPHRGRRFVLNLDLEDFFPSFNFGRVRGFFIKNRDFMLHQDVATIVAQIACHGNVLPQGSPCSPVISDLLAHLLDVRLTKLAKKHSATYSRYADDLTFSTNQKEFPSDLAHIVGDGPPEWVLGAALEQEIKAAGFKINVAKTRMQCRPSRQTVTGLTVNTKVNIRSDYYKAARSMCHSLFRTGSYHRGEIVTAPDGTQTLQRIASLEQLEGVLSHIHYVKNASDIRDVDEKRDDPTAAAALYKKFVFYRHFVALDRPLIVCEGRTDNIYLKSAMRRLPAFHPQLGEWVGSQFKTKLSFFKYSDRMRELLELSGGTGDLMKFIGRYQSALNAYTHKPLKYPVIVLIDNDDGASKILPNLNKKLKIKVDLKSDELFYRWSDNLYIVKTPAIGTEGKSCIESFFDPLVLAEKLGGKTFQPKAPINPATEYGKAAFAEKVVLPKADKIDFSRFSMIFERIIAVLDDYEKYKAALLASKPSSGSAAAA